MYSAPHSSTEPKSWNFLPIYLIALLLITACATPAPKETLEIASIKLQLSADCSVKYTIRDTSKPRVLTTPLPYPETCDFIRDSDTGNVRVERTSNAWVVLIQSHKLLDESDPIFGCDTRFSGLIIKDDQTVRITQETNGGSGCPPIYRDKLAYDAIAHGY